MEPPTDYSSLSGFSSTPSVNFSLSIGKNPWGVSSGFTSYRGSTDSSLFSSSLPVLPHAKLNFADSKQEHRSIDDASSKLNELAKDLDGVALSKFGIFLPDDEEELLAGIADDFDLSGMPNQVEDVEDNDIFGSGGGMELDFDLSDGLAVSMAKASIGDGYSGNGSVQYSASNGEHPYGEHPSRTLFVRNINSNVEDSELRMLFEQYGDIRTLYTACKHRGFVMISYYDIRDARTAMRALQNKPLRRRKLDIHFSIPKDNPPEKDINQGTLVVFNLDPSVTNDKLREVFGAYGEVKEIRETPHKRHHKFIEYYDVRAAEAALRELNRRDIAGKRIKLEPSRPGGARRNLMQQLNQDNEHDETRSYVHQVGSPIINSPPGSWAQFCSPNDNSSLRGLSQSPTLGAGISMVNNHLHGLASVFSSSNSSNGVPFQHPHSFPEHNDIMPNMTSKSANLSSFGPSTSKTIGAGILDGTQFLFPQSSMRHSFTSDGHIQNFPYSTLQGSFIGSAPTGHFGYVPESPKSSFMSQVALGNMGIGRNEGNILMNANSRGLSINPRIALSGKMPENGSFGFRMMPSPSSGHTFLGSAPYPGSGFATVEGLFEDAKNCRVDKNGSQHDSKNQFHLDLEKIASGEDTRTTLMLKNIPNKYTSKMLLAAIDESHRGTYDFLYLPIDFKNKCNVGYAFINMVSPLHIIPFYQEFNGKKWEKFNSEKVASLAYGRIQGKAALVTHFQNSNVMNEDKRCRPILFHSVGDKALDQVMINNSIEGQFGNESRKWTKVDGH